MAGVNGTYTIKQAKALLAPHGMVITSNDGEYRVNFKGGDEATASYHTDLPDAIGTGIDMAKRKMVNELVHLAGMKRSDLDLADSEGIRKIYEAWDRETR
jgi:hypothetical protein